MSEHSQDQPFPQTQVLNLGRLAEGLGACVVGRLVPMRCEPGWVFDSRPREVPDAVGEEVSREVAEQGSCAWVQVLGEAVVSGELDWPLGTVTCLTTLSSDLLPYSWSGPTGELAEAAYEVCASSLRSVTLRDSSVVRAAPFGAAVLVDPHVYGAARDRFTGHDHEAAWEALARNTHEPVSSRCRELAALCRESAEQVD